MSHAATNWAIKQRGIRPAAKVVLWQLCDRYHPDHGCFPSEQTLAHDCEMSERSVRDQIAELKNAGLVKVEKRTNAAGQRTSNRYYFAFEDGFENIPEEKFAGGQPSGKSASKPAANSRRTQRQNLPPNPVKGTRKGTGKGSTTDFIEFEPSLNAREWAHDQGLSYRDIDAQTKRWREHWTAKGDVPTYPLEKSWKGWIIFEVEHRAKQRRKKSNNDIEKWKRRIERKYGSQD